MVDVSQSRWIQGIEGYVKENKEKYKKKILIGTLIFLLVSAVFFVLYFVLEQWIYLVLGIAAAVFGIVLFVTCFGKANKVMRHLEDMVKSKVQDEKALEQFDEEILKQPRAVLETRSLKYIFTENFIMVQNKSVERMMEDELIYLPEIGRVDIMSYSGNSSIAYGVLFYHTGEKKAFARFNFKKKSFGKDFIDKVGESRPELIQQNEHIEG